MQWVAVFLFSPREILRPNVNGRAAPLQVWVKNTRTQSPLHKRELSRARAPAPLPWFQPSWTKLAALSVSSWGLHKRSSKAAEILALKGFREQRHWVLGIYIILAGFFPTSFEQHGSSKSISTPAQSTTEISVRPLSRWLIVQVFKHAQYYSKDNPKNEAGATESRN